MRPDRIAGLTAVLAGGQSGQLMYVGAGNSAFRATTSSTGGAAESLAGSMGGAPDDDGDDGTMAPPPTRKRGRGSTAGTSPSPATAQPSAVSGERVSALLVLG
jgi:hypothetical protein